MDITAKQLQKSSIGPRTVQEEINGILKTFQIEIKEANKAGFTKVVVSVPTNFNIPGMSNSTAQTLIYYQLIQEIQKKGFSVRISMAPGLITYCINWTVVDDSLNLSEMRKVIAAHRVGQ
jgi:hypothetical protein